METKRTPSDEDKQATIQANLLRIRAGNAEAKAIAEAYDNGTASLDRLLDSHRRCADTEIAWAKSLVDYTLAVSRVHRSEGSLLEHHGIRVVEGKNSAPPAPLP